MSVYRSISVVFLVIFLFLGYLATLEVHVRRKVRKEAFGAAAVVLLMLFAFLGIFLFLVFSMLQNPLQVIFFCIVFFSILAFVYASAYIVRNHAKMNISALVLCLVYVGCVLYITLFSREAGNGQTIHIYAFSSFQSALKEQSLVPLWHLFLNFVLFIPLGALASAAVHPGVKTILFPLAAGMMLSSVIEIIQLMYQLGQCDIEDMLGNGAGAVAGFLLFRLYAGGGK